MYIYIHVKIYIYIYVYIFIYIYRERERGVETSNRSIASSSQVFSGRFCPTCWVQTLARRVDISSLRLWRSSISRQMLRASRTAVSRRFSDHLHRFRVPGSGFRVQG